MFKFQLPYYRKVINHFQFLFCTHITVLFAYFYQYFTDIELMGNPIVQKKKQTIFVITYMYVCKNQNLDIIVSYNIQL